MCKVARVFLLFMALMFMAQAAWAGGAVPKVSTQFEGDLSDAWFKVKGKVESRGVSWDSQEIQRMKQGMNFYLHITGPDSSGGYKAQMYSFLYNAYFGRKCWQQQGETDGIEVYSNSEGNEAFFFFNGGFTNYHDDDAGHWCPADDSQGLVWGTIRLIKKDTTGNKFDKMKMEFLFVNVFDNGSVQYAKMKGKSVAAPDADAICGESCSSP